MRNNLNHLCWIGALTAQAIFASAAPHRPHTPSVEKAAFAFLHAPFSFAFASWPPFVWFFLIVGFAAFLLLLVSRRKLARQVLQLRTENADLQSELAQRTSATKNAQELVDDAAHQTAAESLARRNEQVIRHQAALLALSRQDNSDLAEVIRRVTELDAQTLGVARVSVWQYAPDHSAIVCEDLYKRDENTHESGLRLAAEQYPKYFHALEENRTLAAHEAQQDPRTSEFTAGYLIPFGITSMMDVPIRLRGQVVGVLCHEHTGPLRQWMPEEQEFAASLSDTIALAWEAAERKRAEQNFSESEMRLQQIAENINEVLWVESFADHRLLYVSPVYEKIWQRSCASLYDAPDRFIDTVHSDDRDKFRAHYRTQRTGNTSEVEYRIILPDGVERWIWDRSFPIRNSAGQVYRCAGIAQDITERKQMETEIRNYTMELEKLVEIRATRIYELERQRAATEKLAATGRMAARIAHEINNPLAGIKNSFLLIKSAVPVAHQYFPYVGRIEKEIDRIVNIVQQMFKLYRQEHEAAHEFRLDESIRDIITLIETTRRVHEVELELEVSNAVSEVYLPEGALRQVLYNLIQNAIEASPRHGRVKVAAEINDDQLHMSVQNQGHGISEEVRSRLFEPFFTTKKDLSRGGFGLGLSVSKSLVEAMGGSLDFESGIAHGTEFRVTLPRIVSTSLEHSGLN